MGIRQIFLAVGICFAVLLWPPQTLQAQGTAVDAEIVYMDSVGVIHVLDPYPVNNPFAIQWRSPQSGWRDLALGDFNADGDLEIVAIRGESDTGRLTIFDPVVVSGIINPNQLINGIPWEMLYDVALPGRPSLIAAGDLNAAIAGDEIVVGIDLNAANISNPEETYRMMTLQAANSPPNGRSWQPVVPDYHFGHSWQSIALGNFDGNGGAEIALSDERQGGLRVYRLEGRFVKIYHNDNGLRPWDGVATAWYLPATAPKLAALRRPTNNMPSVWVLGYDSGEPELFVDVFKEFLYPEPRMLFAADINGNGDDELFLLRRALGLQPHLIMRNGGDDALPRFEVRLDGDNGYTVGAGGDVDGDSRDEVAVLRNNRIRLYGSPEITTTTFVDYNLVTDEHILKFGNLDASGFLRQARFQVSASTLAETLVAGEQKEKSVKFQLTNIGTEETLNFAIEATDAPAWLSIQPWIGETSNTPTEISLGFDGRTLAAGLYRTTFSISASNVQVSNAPLALDVTLTVLPGLVINPTTLFVPYTCDDSTPAQSQLIAIDAPAGTTFTACILSGAADGAACNAAEANAGATAAESANSSMIPWPSQVAWATASSSNIAPTQLTLTVAPNEITGEWADAHLRIEAIDANKTPQVRTASIVALCTRQRIFLPVIRG